MLPCIDIAAHAPPLPSNPDCDVKKGSCTEPPSLSYVLSLTAPETVRYQVCGLPQLTTRWRRSALKLLEWRVLPVWQISKKTSPRSKVSHGLTAVQPHSSSSMPTPTPALKRWESDTHLLLGEQRNPLPKNMNRNVNQHLHCVNYQEWSPYLWLWCRVRRRSDMMPPISCRSR